MHNRKSGRATTTIAKTKLITARKKLSDKLTENQITKERVLLEGLVFLLKVLVLLLLHLMIMMMRKLILNFYYCIMLECDSLILFFSS